MDRWLSHPTALKILSIVIGVLLWAVVHFDPESTPNTVTSTTETKSVDMLRIQTEGLDESAYALKVLEPSVAKLMVRGSRSALAFAEDGDYTVSVNLSGKGPGSYTIPLTVGKLPRGIELLNVSPSMVEVIIDRLESGMFDAGVVTQGKPAEGYELGAPVIRPGSTVQVTLPAQDLARVGSVKVFVNVEGETETVRDKKARMIVFDKSGNEIQGAVIAPATLDVEVPITMPGKAVPLQIGTRGSLPAGLSLEAIDSDVSEVTVYGERSLLDSVNLLAADVDLSQIRATGDVELELLPPEGMKAVEPSKVKVRVTLASSDVKTLQVPITLENAGSGLDAALEAPTGGTIGVRVRGTPDELSGLTAGDIRAVADLQDLKEGAHEVRLQLTLPNYVTAVDPAPTVTVRLTASEAAMGRPEGGSATPSPTPTPSPDRGQGENDSSGGSGPSHGSGNENDAGAGSGDGADSGEGRR
ncbi:CdaR family protein [Paenibacillus sp. FSL W8-1187]|uniref:Putative secreted protein associated with spyDAC n=1 Tax=Paenibacillus pasadenensis TaxID=217090 RepID=A0A2N5N1K1_9BACL|nr:CdaR family protein [Paenibacillus pasadenensis]PLT44195.1 putative secreted protein associated with spyDAC [Paenibacillus pasadenensis]